MGVVKRQGIKQSIVNFAAVGIAALSMLFVYPLDKEAYGLARFLIDTGYLLMPFITLGSTSLIIRFFPEFNQEEKGYRGILAVGLWITLGGAALFTSMWFLFREHIYEAYATEDSLLLDHLKFVVPVAILTSLFMVMYNYCINHKRIVVPSLFQNLIKFSLPVLILLLVWKQIDYQGLAMGIVANHVLALICISLYIIYIGKWESKPDFQFLDTARKKRMRKYAFYGILSSVGSVLAVRIDTFMIPLLIDFKSNGVYAIAAFIGNTIAIPSTALTQITSPLITQALKDNQLNEVENLYKKTSITLTVVGLLLFVCVIVSVEDLFYLMPKSEELRGGFFVVLFIGLAKIVDMITSVNNQIINYSKYYKFGMYAILFMALFNIIANLVFIPRYQIAGAALATLSSLTMYNLIKIVFIYRKFGIIPFQKNTIYVLMIGGVLAAVFLLLPIHFHPIINIAIRSVIIIAVYLFMVIRFKLSEELVNLFYQGLNKIRKR